MAISFDIFKLKRVGPVLNYGVLYVAFTQLKYIISLSTNKIKVQDQLKYYYVRYSVKV